MSCNQERTSLNPAKNRTGEPIFVHISDHVSVDDDPPLVNGAIATLIDMRKIRIMKDTGIVLGGHISALWLWPCPRNIFAFSTVVLRFLVSWNVHRVRRLPPMYFRFYFVDYSMMISDYKPLTSLPKVFYCGPGPLS